TAEELGRRRRRGQCGCQDGQKSPRGRSVECFGPHDRVSSRHSNSLPTVPNSRIGTGVLKDGGDVKYAKTLTVPRTRRRLDMPDLRTETSAAPEPINLCTAGVAV